MMCNWVMVAEDGGKIRSGIQALQLPELWTNRITSFIFHMFSLDQSHPPVLSGAINRPTPAQAQVALDTHTLKHTCRSPYALMYCASLVYNHLPRASLWQVNAQNSYSIFCSNERGERTISVLSDHTKKSCTTAKTMWQKGDMKLNWWLQPSVALTILKRAPAL